MFVICVQYIWRYLTKRVIKLNENIKQHFCVDQIISFICRFQILENIQT